jgi:hypothetical protein
VVALVLLVRRIGGGADAGTARVFARAAVGAGALALVAAPVAGAVGDADAGHALGAAVAGMVAGGLAYLAVLRLLGVTEIGTIFGLLRNRRRPAAADV